MPIFWPIQAPQVTAIFLWACSNTSLRWPPDGRHGLTSKEGPARERRRCPTGPSSDVPPCPARNPTSGEWKRGTMDRKVVLSAIVLNYKSVAILGSTTINPPPGIVWAVSGIIPTFKFDFRCFHGSGIHYLLCKIHSEKRSFFWPDILILISRFSTEFAKLFRLRWYGNVAAFKSRQVSLHERFQTQKFKQTNYATIGYTTPPLRNCQSPERCQGRW